MEGTLDLGLSKPDEPVFRFLCKSADGPGFNVMVDGKSRRQLTNEQSVEALLDEQQLEQRQQQLAERARQEQEKRKKSLWEQCETEIAKKARDMIGFTWSDAGPPEPVALTELGAVYEPHFQSRNPAGAELFFVAKCIVEDGGAAVVEFRGREGKAPKSRE